MSFPLFREYATVSIWMMHRSCAANALKRVGTVMPGSLRLGSPTGATTLLGLSKNGYGARPEG